MTKNIQFCILLRMLHKMWNYSCLLVTKQSFHHFSTKHCIKKLCLQKLFILLCYIRILYKSDCYLLLAICDLLSVTWYLWLATCYFLSKFFIWKLLLLKKLVPFVHLLIFTYNCCKIRLFYSFSRSGASHNTSLAVVI